MSAKNGVPGRAGNSLPPSPARRWRGPITLMILIPTVFLASLLLLRSVATTRNAAERVKLWLEAQSSGHGWGQTAVEGDEYLLGVGKADITGPVVEINMMGYADPNQIGTGLRQRLFSRAFIVADPTHPGERFVYLVLDTQSGDTAVRYGILSGLQKLGPDYEVYGHHNLAVTGTHSHSGPGAWLNYLLPQITSKGFDKQSYEAIVDGAVLSIKRAHESLAPGRLSVGSTKVFGANINRSLFAYLANPEEERARYNVSTEDDGSVEKDLTLLKFQRSSDGKNIGVLTWFPTHGTSVLGNNTLISGDNKGVAAYLFEGSVANEETAAESFVAGFSQANVGDTSPNVLGAWCDDGSGQMCSFENSTCSDGKSQKCHARGPFFREQDQGTSSCFETGKRQFEPSKKLYDEMNKGNSMVPIRGNWVKSFHSFHNMSNYHFELPNGTEVVTCPAALGYSFAAGTSDWPGSFDFTQHDGNKNTTSPVWRVVSGILKEPDEEQVRCHGAKPILLDVGEVKTPYEWTPNIVDVQAFRVGQLVIIVSPGEATTMAGRRWKEAVAHAVETQLDDGTSTEPPVVVLGGPANSYTHYITTEEEYSIQRFEGASTLYGPHTLAAYINLTLTWLRSLDSSKTDNNIRPPHGPEPPDNSNRSLSFIPSVIRDAPPFLKNFGDVIRDVDTSRPYRKGDVVSATFVGANPRNNLQLEGSYAVVEKLVSSGIESASDAGKEAKEKEWKVVRDDRDWHLVYSWRRTSELLATSEVVIKWETTDPWAESGIYRLRYYGDAKGIGGRITAFEGVSGEFELLVSRHLIR
ncbi:Neutral/alkaline nonlysosomal ceramidase [Xylariaceae sp. FL0594]|nr:Neutral/alkaline nonlysosomal ceramidase [Xylariaceae sp. FL0594]